LNGNHKVCIECGCDFVPSKFTPYQQYCSKGCKNRRYKRIKVPQLTEKRKQLVFDLLGGCCVACGTSDRLVLTVDHVNDDPENDGFQRRDKRALYRFILKNPEEGKKRYQLLCWNCNSLKQFHRADFLKRFPWLSRVLGS